MQSTPEFESKTLVRVNSESGSDPPLGSETAGSKRRHARQLVDLPRISMAEPSGGEFVPAAETRNRTNRKPDDPDSRQRFS